MSNEPTAAESAQSGPTVEHQLPGGRISGATRIENTVRRPPRPWSSGTQALLTHLAEHGFEQAPRYLGQDDQGRDVLTYLPGDTLGEPDTWPSWVWADQLLCDVGHWLRRLHDATRGWQPPTGTTWFTGRPWSPELVIGHHDAAPWNAVVHDDRLVGFVDWDTAAPARIEFDLAWTALTWTPLLHRELAAQRGFTAAHDRARRFHLLLDSYGYPDNRADFASLIPQRARAYADIIRSTTRPEDPHAATMLAWADDLSTSAHDIANLPTHFWTRSSRTPGAQSRERAGAPAPPG